MPNQKYGLSIYYNRKEVFQLETVIYTVLDGNTLWGIANFFGTTTDEIVKLNNLETPELIYPGQQLKIPVGKPMPPKFYAVRPEDTLYLIAKRYGLEVADIQHMNNLSNPNLIYPGQLIRLR